MKRHGVGGQEDAERFDRGAGLVAGGAPEVVDDRAQGQVECFPLGGEVPGTAE
ncbi:hypothetical protein [Micromonospora sp. KC723]|uniref:hypothetical protein n=1 Tax=Micromonospora sp. KC723 TaxID=2530381 RepID=UPI001404B848|nr:hypothetical protein [Micromonospora sp. KC723]